MRSRLARLVLAVCLVVPVLLQAQSAIVPPGTPAYKAPKLPPPNGYRVYIVDDMEGMGSVVLATEVGGNPGTSDYWDQYRHLLTQEVNAVIAGARRGGGRDFVVNEGHGGNRWASILPWELDTAAILIRGWPKPIAMLTAFDSTVGTVMIDGNHANAGTPGVMSHNFVFDSFTVNGRRLGESGIHALIAGQYGVAVSMVTGDDVYIQETKELLGNVVGVVTKMTVSPRAAITWSPAHVRQMIADSAALAVRRAMNHEFKPLTMAKPYQVVYTLRATYSDSVAGLIEAVKFPGLQKTGPRAYKVTLNDAREIGYLLDALENPLVR